MSKRDLHTALVMGGLQVRHAKHLFPFPLYLCPFPFALLSTLVIWASPVTLTQIGKVI